MSDDRTARRAIIHDLVEAELDRSDENYVPGDEAEWGRGDFTSPSVEWYAADVAHYMTRISGNEE